MTKPTVFISYSHKDEEWKDHLVTHLGTLEQDRVSYSLFIKGDR